MATQNTPNFIEEISKYSLKISGYKCFTNEENPQGFETFKRFNVLVGKNNSGKSSLLDLIEKSKNTRSRNYQRPEKEKIYFEKRNTQIEIESIINHKRENYSQKEIGVVTWINNDEIIFYIRQGDKHPLDLALFGVPFDDSKNFVKLSAERDIPSPEGGHSTHLVIDSSGRGVTNVIQTIINKHSYDSKIIEKDFLNAVNSILNPDINLLSITTQYENDNNWEIYLNEAIKGKIAISKSGSGLKTIILALANVILTPIIKNNKVSDNIFAFEELENNLHPALQRRLIDYLINFARDNDCMMFFTTHSNVIIDMFARQEDSQILHVINSEGVAQVKTIAAFADKNSLLDDLGCKASDLLQANSIIWLEGPSDRIYLNHWISLLSDASLKEGLHYQCMFYGGRLLSNLEINDEEVSELINLIKINRNAIVVMDSDKKSEGDTINVTKNRLKAQVEKIGGHAFISHGREIENYVELNIIQQIFPEAKNPFELYVNIYNYLDDVAPKLGNKFKKDKIGYAKKFMSNFEKENMSEQLKIEIKTIIDKIKAWNGL